MPYVKIEPSGCCERHGSAQIRLAMYLTSGDTRYSNHADGSPFHNHFIYDNLSMTLSEIKDLANYHLANFYEAWKQGKPMRSGWDTKHRIRPKRYDESLSPEVYAGRKALCNEKIAKIGFIAGINLAGASLGRGRLFPATDIDVGSGAIDRNSFESNNKTAIDYYNPANESGVLDTFEMWFKVESGSSTKMGTFYTDPTVPDFNVRDFEAIGVVEAGSKQTFTGLDCDVEAGDYIGFYANPGELEKTFGGSVTLYDKNGDQFAAGKQTYTLNLTRQLSLYATGVAISPSRGWWSK
ncbi:hypothetical protein LCGC14_0848630 [marine sediment metagenome]|uniref:Uncharacterized protein n=1 Tax=marine sediment metagenome TaxID=412755 RepID=A0A0F9PW97_9ZZZZ